MRLVPRQKRLIQHLLIRSHSRHELRDLIGSENVPDVVFRLRNRGLNIICKRKPLVTRDGDISHVGYYSIPNEEREKAKSWIKPLAGGSSVSQDKLDKLSRKFNFTTNRQGGLHG